jgi:hypothetical protein
MRGGRIWLKKVGLYSINTTKEFNLKEKTPALWLGSFRELEF